MGNLDPTKIAIVLIVALVVLGPDKLPGFTKQIGAWWGEFQRVRARLQAEINGAVNQINDVASPLTETFRAASTGMGGLIPSIFNGENRQSPQTAVSSVPPHNASSPEPPIDAESPRNASWGSSEAESGYGYGDPRLN